MADFKLTVHVGSKPLAAAAAAALLCAGIAELGSESFTLATYYPAPSGVYSKMITTGPTYLARDGGDVGIGTTSPDAALDVNGTAKMTGFRMAKDAAAGYVLTSDAGGDGSWKAAPGGVACTNRTAAWRVGNYGTVTVNCAAGETVFGGGCSMGDVGDARVLQTYPGSSTSWVCVPATGWRSVTVTAYAVCCK